MSRYVIKLKDRQKFFFKNTWEPNFANIYDTYQAAKAVYDYLKKMGFNCEIIAEKDIQK